MNKMTDEQIKALRYFMAQSKDATNFCKKTMLFLVDESKNLTKSVHMFFDMCGENKKIAKQILLGVHNMQSSGYTTHLDSFFKGMGTTMMLESWSFSSLKGLIAISPYLYRKGSNSKEIKFDKKKIEAIDLPR